MGNEQNDGKKTEAQLAEERLSRYKADPFKFVEMSDIITCVIRTDDGPPMLYIKGTKFELQIAWAELNQKIMTTISKMEMEAAMKKQKIYKPPSFLDGLRGRK